jgi:DNA-binding winged helix-turn-helix (wHTH) protein
MVIRFGALRLDSQAGELRKFGIRIKLQDQPFRVLQVLLEHPGEVASREELQQRVWP